MHRYQTTENLPADFAFQPYESFYATVVGCHNSVSCLLQLDNGMYAYAYIGLPHGSRVLCSLRHRPRNTYDRPLMEVETVLRYGPACVA